MLEILLITVLGGAFTTISLYAGDYATATTQLMTTVGSAILFIVTKPKGETK